MLLAATNLAGEAPSTPWYAAAMARAAALGLPELGDPEAPLTRGQLSTLLFGLARAQARQEGRALPSSGCGASFSTRESLTVDSQGRGLIVSLPEGYDPARPYPLVLAFHGRTSSNAQVQRYYGLERSGTEAIYVYPSGIPETGGSSWTADETGGLAFFDSLLDTLVTRYCVDLGRIFAVGHSLGASYVNLLGCHRGDLLRGVAAVAGGRPYAECRGKTAALLIHNPEDTLVAFEEGLASRDSFLLQNELAGSAVPSEPRSLNCERYGPADASFSVVWCPHADAVGPGGEYYPHTWPQGAGEAVMAFSMSLP